MCTHEITAHFTVADMAQRCDIRKNPGCWGEDYDKNHQVTLAQFPFSPCCATQGIKLIYAGGHCHAPSCISMELFHADTGKLLCAHYPTYGKTHQVFVCPRCCRIFLRSLTNWATLLSHPASGAQKRLKIIFWDSTSILNSGGSDCASLPSFQRQPDFNQAEQQHIHPLRRDGLMADERNPC